MTGVQTCALPISVAKAGEEVLVHAEMKSTVKGAMKKAVKEAVKELAQEEQ